MRADTDRQATTRSPAEESELEHAGRILARGFVFAGGLFWAVAAFAGPYVYQDTSLAVALKTAMWPFMAALVTLVIGWTYERLAGVLLFAASAAVVVWGYLYAWEAGVWLLMASVLIVPMTVSGVLFMLSAHADLKRSLAEESEAATPSPSLSRGRFPAPRGAGMNTRPR